MEERPSEGEEGSRDGAPSGERRRGRGRLEDELVEDSRGMQTSEAVEMLRWMVEDADGREGREEKEVVGGQLEWSSPFRAHLQFRLKLATTILLARNMDALKRRQSLIASEKPLQLPVVSTT